MGTVVLVGYSTAGKSSILRHFKDVLGKLTDVVDSDEEMSREYGGHIYLVYSKLIEGENRNRLDDYIKGKENAILSWLQPSDKPRLIAFGPIVPCRDEWPSFLDRVQPVVFYLELSEHEVREGLRRRRDKHVADGLQSLPAFGSWDEKLTTKFDKESQRWIPIKDEKAILDSIRTNMEIPTRKYREAARRTGGATYLARKLRETGEYQREFYEKVTAALLNP